jgi:hypothetical protein
MPLKPTVRLSATAMSLLKSLSLVIELLWLLTALFLVKMLKSGSWVTWLQLVNFSITAVGKTMAPP